MSRGLASLQWLHGIGSKSGQTLLNAIPLYRVYKLLLLRVFYESQSRLTCPNESWRTCLPLPMSLVFSPAHETNAFVWKIRLMMAISFYIFNSRASERHVYLIKDGVKEAHQKRWLSDFDHTIMRSNESIINPISVQIAPGYRGIINFSSFKNEPPNVC